jgi:hypothetical protein
MMAGPNYLDPNVLGTRLRLTLAYYEIWARKIGEIAAGPREGFASRVRIEYPFWAQANRWAGFVDGRSYSYVYRDISGQDLRWFNPIDSQCAVPPSQDYVNPDTGVDANAACAYRQRLVTINSGIARAIPRSWLIQRFTFGNEFGLNRPSFLSNFPAQFRDAFAARYFGKSERTSSLYLEYDAFTPGYRTYRNLDTFDLGEDKRLGPSLTLKLGRASTLLGSERDFTTFLTEAHINLSLGGGFQSLTASWESRRYSEGWIDQLAKASLLAMTPVLARAVRVVAYGSVVYMADNVHRDRITVGALEGLRGYPVNVFDGYDGYVAHVEARSLGLPVLSLRLGGLVFADAGHAADTWHELQFYGDAGAGLRLLVPQLNAEVLRCDWAFPFRGYKTQKAGWPGRLSCGFHQAF